jgi:hypothetical protein
MPSTSSQPPVEEPDAEEPPQDSEADGDSEADDAGEAAEKRADGADADSGDDAADQADEAAPEEPRGDAAHPYKFFYAKKYYQDPGVFVFDKGHAMRVADGAAAASIASAKAVKTWRDNGLQTRHVKKAKSETGETVFYVTFKFGDEENTGDRVVPRAIPKEVSKKIFEEWKEAGWSDKKKEMFGELLKDAPSENSQLNPIAAGWKEVKAPADVKFFKQPSKKRAAADDAATGEPSAKAAKAGKQGAKSTGDAGAPQVSAAGTLMAKSRAAEDDAQSMGGQSTSILPLSGTEQGGSGQRGFSFYAHTPGMVNISEALFRELMERAYGTTSGK